MAHDVFISYVSDDKKIADAICGRLEATGIRCWIAPRDITPGDDWSAAIVEAINSSRVCILVFSAHANDSPQIKREVERAVHNGNTVIPFRLDDIQPSKSLEYFISTAHWLDAISPPVEQHIDRLGVAVKQIIGSPDSEHRQTKGKLPTAEVRAQGRTKLPFRIPPVIAAIFVFVGIFVLAVLVIEFARNDHPSSRADNNNSSPTETPEIRDDTPAYDAPNNTAKRRYMISIMSAERCIIEWRPISPTMTESVLKKNGIDMDSVKKHIVRMYAAVAQRDSTGVTVLPDEPSDLMPGPAYYLSSLGVNDERYDSFHIYVRSSDVSVSLYKAGDGIPILDPNKIGIDWRVFQDGLAHALQHLHQNRLTVECGDVKIVEYGDESWNYQIPYMLIPKAK